MLKLHGQRNAICTGFAKVFDGDIKFFIAKLAALGGPQ